MTGAFALPRARVRAAVAHERPAVVGARLQDVDLVAAVGTVFVGPDLAGAGVDGEAELVAMSQRVDLGLCSRFPGKRIVRWNASIVADAEHLAALISGVLREVRILLIAARRRDVEHAVPAEDHARGAGLIENEDVLD